MDVVVEPPGLTADRGLQTQTKAVEKGVAHSRLAVTYRGGKDDLARGMYRCPAQAPPLFFPDQLLVRVLPQPLRRWKPASKSSCMSAPGNADLGQVLS